MIDPTVPTPAGVIRRFLCQLNHRLFLPRALLLWSLLSSVLLVPSMQAETLTLVGRVLNAETGNYLEGATVELVDPPQQTVTARDGSFRFAGLPAGKYSVRVNYVGLDAKTLPVELAAGSDGVVIALTAQVYQLEQFTVVGVREGEAAAVTAQKNAPNVVNIVAMDAYGSVADGNIGNFLQRLPGIDQSKSNGDVQGFGVRGMAQALSTVSMDGSQLAAANAGSSPVGDRAFPIDNMPAELVETLKLTKAPTPNMPADSLGGNVELVTKSAFAVQGRRITYRAGFNYNTYRGDTALTPTAALTYLDTLGANRDWGVTFTASFSSSTNTRDRLQNSLVAAPDGSGVLVNGRLRLLDDVFTRDRFGTNFKLEHKVNDRLSLRFDAIYTSTTFDMDRNDYRISGPIRLVDYNVVSRVAIEGGATARNTAGQTASLAPGFSADYQELVDATLQNSAWIDRKENYMYKVGASADWKLDDGWLNFNASHNRAESEDRLGQYIASWGRGKGVSFDTSADRNMPAIQQTYGPNMFYGSDLSRFNNLGTASQWIAIPQDVRDQVDEVRVDWHREISNLGPVSYVRAGAAFREKDYGIKENTWTYNFRGADNAVGTADDNITQFRNEGPGYAMFNGFYPAFDTLNAGAVSRYFDANPSHFVQAASDVFKPEASLTESVTSAYVMANASIGKLDVLGGVRMEHTGITGTGTRQVNATPVLDFLTKDTHFTDYFPGIHFRYTPIKNLVFRASATKSMGRPGIRDQVPTTSVRIGTSEIPGSPAPGSVRANNIDLRPMYADNFEIGAEYYFKRIGLVAVNFFQKNIEGYIASLRSEVGVGPDNGFGGLYEGYDLITTQNLSEAEVKGVEFNYAQSLSFLPGFWRGFTVMGNITHLDTTGTYANEQNELPGFKPVTANAGVTYQRGRLQVRAFYNYNKGHLSTFSTNPLQKTYTTEDKTLDLNLQFRITRRFTFFFDANNVFDWSPGTWVINRNEVVTYERNGTRISAGFTGRF
ncbi:MAG: TonB-dependent receptor [Candidatus Didemnitutus sp.]|nr:TonB-dependent receptor [Candidatus Didemnitutus sp.]